MDQNPAYPLPKLVYPTHTLNEEFIFPMSPWGMGGVQLKRKIQKSLLDEM